MARIRIVDAWLRYPHAQPSYSRAVMVTADTWAEQRVLMHAFTTSPDQTRPTIMLYGSQLAIGPASLDPHGVWGIHIEPPVDGRAQQLRTELELAAKRLAGSKGTPARLLDEEPEFDRRRTNHWAPGQPRALPDNAAATAYYEPGGQQPQDAPPAHAYPPPAPPLVAADAPPAHAYPPPAPPPAAPPAAPPPASAAPPGARPSPYPNTLHMASLPASGAADAGASSSRRRRITAHGYSDAQPHPQHGHQTNRHAGAALGRSPGPRPVRQRRLASLVGYTMPSEFSLTAEEQSVLDALDAAPSLSAGEIAALSGAADGAAWMQALLDKLARFGLDLIETRPGADNEPAYALRR